MTSDLPPPPAGAPVPDAVALLHALGQTISWNALRRLAAAGPQSVNDLAAATGCAPISMSRHLNALWAAGAVVAVAPPDGDGRKACYALPPERQRTTFTALEIDYGVCVLRLPLPPTNPLAKD